MKAMNPGSAAIAVIATLSQVRWVLIRVAVTSTPY